MGRLKEVSTVGGERTDAIDHCLSGIARLQKEVKDASSYVPAYDLRTYGQVSSCAQKFKHRVHLVVIRPSKP